ncbi:MAG: 3-isopropylmalate dehydrogenase [Chloroflexi bacterium AL-W]|nr:3-isopropylmalate dehydrogenase [Chloroflexi bacterium AL-N1]NOK67514.1 3-isopropylmalate dehydrogenase [Chloroflexi bacterium AL-N10]NOK74994.1 3-isopropylmalate dehydrogenase [Chloroflexi bacterium AL-N5]NOK81781.1 3-isopropylmalate dehydrogenase [Chloroflexi bacterium AL-W]NOK89627.1 3-isopropylmalate dehydrogenase [Chloroflexi bacterium AL-N15]
MQVTITILPGDGIGPEVVAEGVNVLQAVAAKWGHQFALHEALIGGCAIDATGQPLPAETLTVAQKSDAVLLGAVGGPKWDNPDAKVRPEQGLLGIRKALGLFANLRPVTIFPQLVAASPLRPERLEGVDLLVMRELTGGIYFGEKRRERAPNGEECALDSCVYTTSEIERIVRMAAEAARTRRGQLMSVDKANVLETSRLWRSVTTRVMSEEFPDVQLDHMLVDACAMHLIRRPSDFDVIVTENMFGDILTDEASMLAGSMGMLPSASLGAPRQTNGAAASIGRMGLYEPIHGSAPDIAGKGVANPLAMILSTALMLRYSLGLEQEAQAIETAVGMVLEKGLVTGDVAPAGARSYSTSEVGQAVVSQITQA